MKMKRKRSRSRDMMEDKAFMRAITRFLSGDQYLGEAGQLVNQAPPTSHSIPPINQTLITPLIRFILKQKLTISVQRDLRGLK